MTDWQIAAEFEDILYHKADGMAKITINRPQVRNAFRPKTITEMITAFTDAREDVAIGVILLTGAGPPMMVSTHFARVAIKRFVEMADTFPSQVCHD